ncbi:MAG: lytic transglycosylase domain-containing protein [Thermoplasmatales archaeon]
MGISRKSVNPPSPEVLRHIHMYSKIFNLDKYLIKAIIMAESNFNPTAVSPKGAAGLMQLMPETARLVKVSNRFDPEQNIYGGIKYFRHLLDRFNQNVVLALAAYNAGPENVVKYGGVPPFKETQNYVRSVLNLWRQFRGSSFAG